MLRRAVGMLRGGFLREIRPQRVLQKGGTQLRMRQMTSSSTLNTALSQLRARNLKPSQLLRLRFSNPKASMRVGQPRPPFSSPRRTFHTSKVRRSQQPPKEPPKEPPAEPQSLRARLKKLSREYGWAAFGIYLGLTVLDFPFCFLLVRALGTDRIGKSCFQAVTESPPSG
jgi:hypothetical protein